MNNPVRSLLAGAACCLTLAGCFGGAAAPVRSETQLRAETALRRGIRAEQKGDRLDAEMFLKQSLAISTSVEDHQFRTTALINLARLYRLRHDLVVADSSIDLAIAASGTDSPLWAEITYEKALIELAKGNSGAALEWAKKSISAERGDLHGRRLNLAGRIQVARGDWNAAEEFAGKALTENRAAEQAEEEANSLRILGVATRKQGRFDPGITHLLEALRIDKKMGKSGKIAMDLEELSATFHAVGRLKESASYLERAFEVNFAAGRLQQAGGNQEALAVIYTTEGDGQKAASARETARKLATETALQNPAVPSSTINPSNRP